MASYPIYPISASCPLPTRAWTYTFSSPTIIEAGTTANSEPPFSNTKEILVYNGSTADPIFVGFILVYPTFPPTPGDLGAFVNSSTIVPPGTGLTLSVGPEGYRVPLNTSGQWAQAAAVYGAYAGAPTIDAFINPPPVTRVGSGYNFVLYAPTVTIGFDVNVTYVQGPGGGGGQTP